ncbi:hypothetical protein ACFSJ3_12400 [Corallincola platygyrae]|uniref:Uncharacterized protein n=1 Tax=Corallincola platygyrae TaxID=1193278 RepID=A0ABW4XNQ5_9GAMM
MLVERIKHITNPNFEKADGTPLIIKRREGVIIAVRTEQPERLYRVSAAVGRDDEGKPLGFVKVTLDHVEDAREGALFAWQTACKQAKRKTGQS